MTRYFNRTKPFYPIVVHYQIQLLGARELAMRGVLGPRDIEATLKSLVTDDAGPPTPDKTREYLRRLSRPMKLKLESNGSMAEIDPDEIASEMLSNRGGLVPFSMRSAGTLLLLAHEETKRSPARDGGPLWEFLRHCRNAVGHDGRFRFAKHEPVRLAAWKKFTLRRDMEGTRLFHWPGRPGLLGPGDPIELLCDIEEAYPGL